MNNIAERFLALRGNAKQGEFAKKLQINPNTLRNYENGRVLPNQEILERICVEFSVSADWLLLGRGPMRPDDAPQTQDQHDRALATLPHEVALCPRCTKLEEKLDRLEEERRELSKETRSQSTENKEWAAKVEQLLRENGDLRERCARFEEKQACGNLR